METKEELAAQKNEAGTLSEDELGQVAGGGMDARHDLPRISGLKPQNRLEETLDQKLQKVIAGVEANLPGNIEAERMEKKIADLRGASVAPTRFIDADV